MLNQKFPTWLKITLLALATIILVAAFFYLAFIQNDPTASIYQKLGIKPPTQREDTSYYDYTLPVLIDDCNFTFLTCNHSPNISNLGEFFQDQPSVLNQLFIPNPQTSSGQIILNQINLGSTATPSASQAISYLSAITNIARYYNLNPIILITLTELSTYQALTPPDKNSPSVLENDPPGLKFSRPPDYSQGITPTPDSQTPTNDDFLSQLSNLAINLQSIYQTNKDKPLPSNLPRYDSIQIGSHVNAATFAIAAASVDIFPSQKEYAQAILTKPIETANTNKFIEHYQIFSRNNPLNPN